MGAKLCFSVFSGSKGVKSPACNKRGAHFYYKRWREKEVWAQDTVQQYLLLKRSTHRRRSNQVFSPNKLTYSMKKGTLRQSQNPQWSTLRASAHVGGYWKYFRSEIWKRTFWKTRYEPVSLFDVSVLLVLVFTLLTGLLVCLHVVINVVRHDILPISVTSPPADLWQQLEVCFCNFMQIKMLPWKPSFSKIPAYVWARPGT